MDLSRVIQGTPPFHKSPEDIMLSRSRDPQSLLDQLELEFHKPLLLRIALTHRSYLKECNEADAEDNKRLEFVGTLSFL